MQHFYATAFGSFPFNAYLAAILACIGGFVLAGVHPDCSGNLVFYQTLIVKETLSATVTDPEQAIFTWQEV
jgi:hypothetical protein